MIQLVLISHGKFCEGIMDAIRMVAGEDFGIRTLSLTPDMSPEGYRKELATILSETSSIDSRGSMVLADIAGGTPFNSAIYLKNQFRIGIIAGVNVPMVLAFAMDRDETDTLDTLLGKVESPFFMGVKAIGPGSGKGGKHGKLSAHKD
ncbi:PTS sugar transporter subunit IIA [Coriobacteriales bacterium OH1046]|nr:PTS sugar transporter subunit IIA [Coriobacteriales bacterium OH1046]